MSFNKPTNRFFIYLENQTGFEKVGTFEAKNSEMAMLAWRERRSDGGKSITVAVTSTDYGLQVPKETIEANFSSKYVGR